MEVAVSRADVRVVDSEGRAVVSQVRVWVCVWGGYVCGGAVCMFAARTVCVRSTTSATHPYPPTPTHPKQVTPIPGRTEQEGTFSLAFFAASVPPLGWTTYYVGVCRPETHWTDWEGE